MKRIASVRNKVKDILEMWRLWKEAASKVNAKEKLKSRMTEVRILQ